MQFVSNRTIVVRSKATGHSIAFEKGKPTTVPKGMHEEVLEKGILPVDEAGKPVDPAENKVITADQVRQQAPEDGETARAKILEALKQVVARNKSTDFTGGGQPSAEAVTSILGYRVDGKEVRDVWVKHRATILNKE